MRYAYVAHLGPDGAVATYSVVAYASGAPGAAVRVRILADFSGDSVHLTVMRGDSTKRSTNPKLPGMIPVLEPAFAPFEVLARQAIAAKGARIPQAEYYLGETYPGTAVLAKPDLVLVSSPSDTVRIRVDERGRIVSATDPGGTLQATVTRVSPPDLDKWAAEFAARDAKGQALGQLSPRDTVRATVAGTHVLVDYGRPSKRGRTIFGAVVPFNTVWRTGANAATTLVIDRDIMLGDTRVPAGTYTLFSVPAEHAWTLIVSKKTGEWGTEYDPTADLARVPMETSTVKDPVERFTISVAPDGVMAMTWDTRVGRVTLKPVTQGS
jgi:hypothetical protein